MESKLDIEKLWQTGNDELILEMTLTRKIGLDSDLTTHWNVLKILKEIAKRERCPLDHVGVVLDNGRIILSEESENDFDAYLNGTNDKNKRHPVDLDLELVLGKMPRKVNVILFKFSKT